MRKFALIGAVLVSGVVGCGGSRTEGAKAEPVEAASQLGVELPRRKIVAPEPSSPIVLGYFTNWAHARPAPYDFRTSDVDASLFTHLAYAFAGIEVSPDREHYSLALSAPEDARLVREVMALKEKNPRLEVLLSVGGWAMNDSPTEWIFTSLAETPERRGRFIRQTVRLLREHGFDGLDVDWEFPGAPERGGRAVDRENFTALLREFRAHMRAEAEASGRPELRLTIAAPAGPFFAQHLDLSAIHEPLDWINVMTYDYHGEWEERTGANAPMDDEGPDLVETIAMYRAAGTPAKKLVLGLATYARGWGGVEKPALGESSSAKLAWKPAGGDALTAHEIAAKVATGALVGGWDERSQTPLAYDPKTKSLFSYDSVRSYDVKLAFLAREGLGGAMFWAIDLDDYRSGFPLIGHVSRAVLGEVPRAAE